MALSIVAAVSRQSAPPTTSRLETGLSFQNEFTAIYEAHFDFVWRSLRRLGVPTPALDDAAQEVFLVAQRRLVEFEGRSSMKTWLFSIALRVSKRAKRLQKRSCTTELQEGIPDHRRMAPDEAASRAEEVRIVYRILDTLEENQREVFVLADLEQMPGPEIAQALDIPLNTVYSRLRLARRRFEDALRRIQEQQNRRQPWRT